MSPDGQALAGRAEGLAQRLRQADPPVVARIEGERVLLDPRTVLPEEGKGLVGIVKEAMG